MEIYQPEADSYLLSDAIKKYCLKNNPKKVLDMGSGSGIQSQTCIDNKIKPENITLVDINSNSINHLKLKFPKSKVIKSDLFSKIKNKYDLIVFNPPYLPNTEHDSGVDTTGGKKGSEVINGFLNQAQKYLNKEGKVLILVSSLTKDTNFKKYKKKLVAEKKLFFEKLFVYELWLTKSSKD